MSADTINKAINDAAAVRDPLDELVEKAAADPGAAFEPDALTLLITLKQENPADFQRVRARLKNAGTIIGELDKLLGAKTGDAKETPGQGQALTIDEHAPYDAAIDGTALLDDIARTIRECVILPDKAADAVTLWAVMTYGVDIFDCLPRLYIHSPERECGKTTLLNCVSRLAWRALPASNISSASTFRVIEKAHPTLCLDESDTFLAENLELRGVINSGHTRASAFTIRNVGEDHEPARFSTFTPIAIAGIGRIHDTTESRSIIISMRRKKKGETVKRLRDHEREPFATLAQKIRRWVNDNRGTLAKCDPAMPEALGDRAADNWRPLLAIADTAGGEWPERARRAAITLSAGGDAAAMSFRTQLLADIRTVFAAEDADKLPSKELANALVEMEGHPWAEWKGKPLSQNTLARLLAPFDIVPSTIRIGEKNTPKGYKREQFADDWARYLPPAPHESTAIPPQGAENLDSPSYFEPQHRDDCGGSETAENARETAVCGGVADAGPPSRETEK